LNEINVHLSHHTFRASYCFNYKNSKKLQSCRDRHQSGLTSRMSRWRRPTRGTRPAPVSRGNKKDGVLPGTTRKPPSSVLAKDTRRPKPPTLAFLPGTTPATGLWPSPCHVSIATKTRNYYDERTGKTDFKRTGVCRLDR